MTTFSPSGDILRAYPEKSPFDLKTVYNLSPDEDILLDHDTNEMRQAALSIANATNGHNVFSSMYASSPFPLDYKAVEDAILPLHPDPPSPLPEVQLSSSAKFLEEVKYWRVPAFVIRVDEQDTLRLLKVYPRTAVRHLSEQLDPPHLFAHDKTVYAHFLHYGACEKGSVPMCYGSVELRSEHVAQILAMQTLSDTTRAFLAGADAFDAILLEHFVRPEPLTMANLSNDFARRALKSLCWIHASYVVVGALSCRNIFVVERDLPPIPRGPCDVWEEIRRAQAREEAKELRLRMVWIDFESATCPTDKQLNRLNFYQELRRSWDYFYKRLLPDKRIGYERAFRT